jgi:hypothetical protein
LSVKGILFDLDGPLLVDGTATPQAGIPDLLGDLHERTIQIGAMTSRPDGVARLKQSELRIDKFGAATKGTGKVAAAFCKACNIELNECLTVFQDEYGFHEAINGPTLGFHAEWGCGVSKYGIRLEKPHELIEYLDIFFLKKHLWFGSLDTRDGDGKNVMLRSLIDGNGAGEQTMKNMLYRTLKERQDVSIADGTSLSSFLMTQLFASAYLEGLFSSGRDFVFWQIYPGSSPSSDPPPIIQETIARFKFFRSHSSQKNFSGLCRQTAARRSHTTRMAGSAHLVTFVNQMNTIALTPNVKRAVRDKRVYVIDDFTTKGYSLEAARLMFYAAGARTVYLLAFGKYGSNYVVQTPRPGLEIKPASLGSFSDSDFIGVSTALQIDAAALAEFTNSIKLLKTASIRKKLLQESQPK